MKKNFFLLTKTFLISLLLLFLAMSAWAVDFDAATRISAWQKAWMNKTLDNYMYFYGNDFKSDGIDYDGWKARKKIIFSKTHSIDVEVSNIQTQLTEDKAIVKFLQKYTSDNLSDFGEKTLTFQKEGYYWKIISEEWQSLSSGDTASAKAETPKPTAKQPKPAAVQPKPIVEKLDVITHLEGPMGNGGVMAYTVMGNFISKYVPNLILRPQETPGYLYNIREMANNSERWPDTVFGTTETVINLAYTAGGTPLLKNFIPEKIDTKWKLLCSMAVSTSGKWFLTFDPDIKSIYDLKGKKIGIGLRTQNEFGMDATLFLDKAYGINSKNSKLFYLGPAKMTEALLDGKVDAICMGMVGANSIGTKHWLPTAIYLKLKASGHKLNYISLDTWAIDKINKEFGTTYQSEKMPAGTLKDQDKDVYIGATRTFTAAHPSFPEDLAYKLVMALATTAPKVKEYHPVWKYVWSLEGMVSGLNEENAHPGAIKAYKELGIWDKRTEYPAYHYPEGM